MKSVPTQLCLTALWQGHHQAAALSCPQRTLNCVCVCVCVCVHARTQSCLTLCDPMDYSPPGSSVHGIFQARIMEWVAIFYFRGSSQLRIETMSPVSPALAGEFFTNCATWDAPQSSLLLINSRNSTPLLSLPYIVLLFNFLWTIQKVFLLLSSPTFMCNLN